MGLDALMYVTHFNTTKNPPLHGCVKWSSDYMAVHCLLAEGATPAPAEGIKTTIWLDIF